MNVMTVSESATFHHVARHSIGRMRWTWEPPRRCGQRRKWQREDDILLVGTEDSMSVVIEVDSLQQCVHVPSITFDHELLSATVQNFTINSACPR